MKYWMLALSWYLFGEVIWIWILMIRDPVVRRRDIVPFLLGGFLGPIIAGIAFTQLVPSEWWDKPIWPRNSSESEEAQ